jgi:hypothetical protein
MRTSHQALPASTNNSSGVDAPPCESHDILAVATSSQVPLQAHALPAVQLWNAHACICAEVLLHELDVTGTVACCLNCNVCSYCTSLVLASARRCTSSSSHALVSNSAAHKLSYTRITCNSLPHPAQSPAGYTVCGQNTPVPAATRTQSKLRFANCR